MQRIMNERENTPYTMWVKVVALTHMNMRYEREIMIPSDLSGHPYSLTNDLIKDTQKLFEILFKIKFIDSKKRVKQRKRVKKRKKNMRSYLMKFGTGTIKKISKSI